MDELCMQFFEAAEMKPIHQFGHFLELRANHRICTHQAPAPTRLVCFGIDPG